MGGEGSGRKPDVMKAYNPIRFDPPPPSREQIAIENLSGVKKYGGEVFGEKYTVTSSVSEGFIKNTAAGVFTFGNAGGAGGAGIEVPLVIASGGTGQITAIAAFDALAPTTTLGDLITFSGSNNIRLPLGTSGNVLTAVDTGIIWAASTGGTSVTFPLAIGSGGTGNTTIGSSGGTVLTIPLALASGGTGQTTNTAAFDALAPTTTQGDIIYYNGTDNVRLAAGTSGGALMTQGSTVNPKWGPNNVSAGVIFVISSGGAISSGAYMDVVMPFTAIVKQWTMLPDQSGSIIIDLWRDTYTNYPPTAADRITGTTVPTITANTKNQSSTLTGWSPLISAGNVLRANVSGAATSISQVSLILEVEKQ